MGNSSSSHGIELKSLAHQINAHLFSQSTLLYQISLIKQILNSRSSVSASQRGLGISLEISELPVIIEKIQALKAEFDSNPQSALTIPPNISEVFKKKEKEIFDLEFIYSDEEKKINEMLLIRNELAESLKSIVERRGQNEFGLDDLKARCSEMSSEIENLNTVITELREKIDYLNKKKSEVMISRGNRRKTLLGMSLVNKAAMDLRSKYILKQDLIKTIQNTKVEQDEHQVNFELRNQYLLAKKQGIEEEAASLQFEIEQNKDKIVELEWEIEKLKKERNRFGSDFSMPFGLSGHGEESDHGSLGSSIGSLLDGFKDFRLETEALAEENLKLKDHVKDIVSVKKIGSFGFNISK